MAGNTYQWTDASHTAIRETTTTERVITVADFQAEIARLANAIAAIDPLTDKELRAEIQALLDTPGPPADRKQQILDAINNQETLRAEKVTLQERRQKLLQFRDYVLSVVQNPLRPRFSSGRRP
jgi:hypothetical protein